MPITCACTPLGYSRRHFVRAFRCSHRTAYRRRDAVAEVFTAEAMVNRVEFL
jgi:hypothetical protein